MKVNIWSLVFIGSLILIVGIISYFIFLLGPEGSVAHKILFYVLIAIAFFTAILAVFMGFSFISSFISSLKIERKEKKNRRIILKLSNDLLKELFWVPDIRDGVGTLTEWFQIIQTYRNRFEMTGLSREDETYNPVKSFRIFLEGALGRYPGGWNKAEGDLAPRMDQIVISGKQLPIFASLMEKSGGSNEWLDAIIVNQAIIKFMEAHYETLKGLITEYDKK